ncbi:MAG: glycosyltransferase family 2 protein [Planctomycetota bacterium]
MDVLWNAIGSSLAVLTLPGTIELSVLTAAALLPSRRTLRAPAPSSPIGSLAVTVVIPAHDEEAGIARCLASVRACETDGEPTRIVVVADNCTDATADVARAAGAEVIVRRDETRRGKGFALEHAFERLLEERTDVVVVIDADSLVDTGMLRAVRNAVRAGCQAVQMRYEVANPEASVRARLAHVAWLAFNVLRLRGRERLGVSVGILGNGFALTTRTLRAVPYTAHGLVEDLEYHLMLVRARVRVHYLASTVVRAAAPTGAEAMASQRSRWDGGRLRTIADTAPRLLGAVLRGRTNLLEPLLELSLLPLSMHVGLVAVAALVPSPIARTYAAVAALVLALHVVAALVVGGARAADWRALLGAPIYVAWKLALLPRTLLSARRRAPWIRTEREPGAVESIEPRRYRSTG